jgi:aryl-alcohol dehydrogenase-like predicted oxidoreductase
MRAFDDLAVSGKVLYAGLSNFPAWLTSRAATLAELRGLIPLAGVQFEYSLVERGADREIFPMAEALGVGAALWSPLGGGLLTGKYRSGDEGRLLGYKPLVHTEDGTRKTAIVDAVLQAAGDIAISPTQVAVAWLLERARRSPTGVVPITGPRTTAQLDSYLGALSVDLGDAVFGRLEEVSRIDLGQPYDLPAGERPLGGDASGFLTHPVPTA